MTATVGPSLNVLDVGHGSCAVLHEMGRTVVFDAGPRSGLLEYLRETGTTTLDLVLISHADQDHISGVLAILGTNLITIKRFDSTPILRRDRRSGMIFSGS